MEGGPGRPGPVDLKSGNIHAKWQNYKQKFEIYMIALKKDKEDSAVKWAYLMADAGPDALGLYNSFRESLVTNEITVGQGVVVTDNSRNLRL